MDLIFPFSFCLLLFMYSVITIVSSAGPYMMDKHQTQNRLDSINEENYQCKNKYFVYIVRMES